MTRQKVLENFLNSKVEPITKGLYRWRGIPYEVIPYNAIKKDKRRRVDHFIKVQEGGVWYGIRELSNKVLMKFYGLPY